MDGFWGVPIWSKSPMFCSANSIPKTGTTTVFVLCSKCAVDQTRISPQADSKLLWQVVSTFSVLSNMYNGGMFLFQLKKMKKTRFFPEATTLKTNMTMEHHRVFLKRHFQMVDFPASHVSFPGCTSTDYWGSCKKVVGSLLSPNWQYIPLVYQV